MNILPGGEKILKSVLQVFPRWSQAVVDASLPSGGQRAARRKRQSGHGAAGGSYRLPQPPLHML